MVRNSVGGIGDAIDTRGKGGFVVAAPSPGYKWLGPSIVDLAPPPIPVKVLAAIEAAKAKPADRATSFSYRRCKRSHGSLHARPPGQRTLGPSAP